MTFLLSDDVNEDMWNTLSFLISLCAMPLPDTTLPGDEKTSEKHTRVRPPLWPHSAPPEARSERFTKRVPQGAPTSGTVFFVSAPQKERRPPRGWSPFKHDSAFTPQA